MEVGHGQRGHGDVNVFHDSMPCPEGLDRSCRVWNYKTMSIATEVTQGGM